MYLEKPFFKNPIPLQNLNILYFTYFYIFIFTFRKVKKGIEAMTDKYLFELNVIVVGHAINAVKI